MKITSKHIQANFFSIDEHQYDPKLILYPPLHTRLEIDNILNRLKGLPKDAVIADFGSGTGRLTIPLLRKGYKVWAIDISDASLSKLKQVADKIPDAKYHIAKTLPGLISFDAIIGADILHHITVDDYLPQFYQALKKNGKVVFTEPGAYNPAWYIYLPFFNWQVEKGFMNNSYTRLKKSFKSHGFSKLNIQGLGILPRPILNFSSKLGMLNESLGNKLILKYFAYRYIIEAVK